MKQDYIYHELAKAIDDLIEVNNPHTYSDSLIDDEPASYVRVWFGSDSHAPQPPKTTILFHKNTIDATHQSNYDIAPEHTSFDLADPNCWEALLRWMKDNSLTPQSTVFTGELADDYWN